MKKIFLILLAAAAVSVSCARESASDTSGLNAEALAAYMQKYHSDAVRTALGVYIYPALEVPGTGSEIGDEKYIRIHITSADREGRLSSSTLDSVNRSHGKYNPRNYYGPVIYYRGEDNLSAGLEQLLTGDGTSFGPMKEGGTRTALVPGWLMTRNRYDTEQEYISSESGTTTLYTITLVQAIEEVDAWEKDSLARYIAANYPDAREDSLVEGWYYVVTKPSKDTASLSSSEKIYCRYTLRDLGDRVIDSNIEKVARDNGFYSSDASYDPMLINWDADYTRITMTSSENDVVDGFANAFLHMHPYEAGTAIFWSGLGYAAKGSGNTIPAYCPLKFDIELVDN